MDDRLRRRRLPQMSQVDLGEISELTHACFFWGVEKSGVAGGLIRFAGSYRHGSSGEGDALFIKWRIREFLELPPPVSIEGLVVDFSSMDYEWGDDLDVPVSRLRRQGRPVRVVVAQHRLAMYQGVLNESEIRTDVDLAVEEVDQMLRDFRY